MINIFKNVLVLAPHTDDGELGAGGTISKLLAGDAQVTYIAFSAAEESVPDDLPRDVLRHEVREATAVLGIDPANLRVLEYQVRCFDAHRQEILEELVRLGRDFSPDLVILPSSDDVHQDHAVIHIEGRRAFKHCSMLGYEMPWNNFSFSPGYFSTLSEHDVAKKIDAINAYCSQSRRPYTNPQFIEALARSRGVQIGTEFAEAFEVIRLVD